MGIEGGFFPGRITSGQIALQIVRGDAVVRPDLVPGPDAAVDEGCRLAAERIDGKVLSELFTMTCPS